MAKPEAENGGEAKAEDPQYCKLFVGGLAYTTTDEQLKDFYAQFGEITDSIVMRDSATGRSRGFGFVTYKNMSQVDNAMNNRPHVIEAKTVDPKRAMPREISIKSESTMSTQKLYVNGVDEMSEDELKEYFGQFGTVVQVEMKADKNNASRKFAFVSFDDYDPVDRCLLTNPHDIQGHRCNVQKSLGKDEQRRAQQIDRERLNRDGRSRGIGRSGGGDYRRGGGAGGYGGGGYGGGGGGWNQGGGGGGWADDGWNQGGARGGGWSQGGGWAQGAAAAGGGGGWNQGYGGGYGQGGAGWSQNGGGGGWGAQQSQPAAGGWGGAAYDPQPTTAYPQQQPQQSGWSQGRGWSQPGGASGGGAGGQQWSQSTGGGRGY